MLNLLLAKTSDKVQKLYSILPNQNKLTSLWQRLLTDFSNEKIEDFSCCDTNKKSVNGFASSHRFSPIRPVVPEDVKFSISKLQQTFLSKYQTMQTQTQK